MVVASGPRGLAQTNVRPEGQTVHLLRGSITGTVIDDRGGPLAGAVVSALGATMAMTVSDGRGLLRARRAADRRIRRPGASERLRRFARASASRSAPPRRPSSASCCASSTSPVGIDGNGDAGLGAADHGGRIRAARVDPHRPAGLDRRGRDRRSSAHRNRVAPAPHQAQHPEGRHGTRHRVATTT